MKYFFYTIAIFVALAACKPEKPRKLPYIGEREVVNGDSIYTTIPDFSFLNQDSIAVTNQSFDGKIRIADFFFTSCPTICPKLAKQMLRIYDKFKSDDRVRLISHTIDPKRDTPSRLKQYAQKLEVAAPKWQFVTGNKKALHEIANDYYSIALDNADAPGGFDHSGRIILVDKNRHVRAFCDGTDPISVEKFMEDIELLLSETK
jgi:protein SCO1/2